MESRLKRGSLECSEGEEVQKADSRVPMTGLCISTKTLRLKDVYKRAFYSGGEGVAHERTSKAEQRTKGRTVLQKNLSSPCGSPGQNAQFGCT